MSHSKPDNNDDIMKYIQQRLDIGKQRYGHGVIIDDDLSKYGCTSWTTMGLEEILDLCVYIGARMIQINKQEESDAIKISKLEKKIHDQDTLIGDLLALRR